MVRRTDGRTNGLTRPLLENRTVASKNEENTKGEKFGEKKGGNETMKCEVENKWEDVAN